MWIRIAAVLGFLGVALGAFGAHVIAPRVPAPLLDAYRTGVLYHLVHALALLAVALAAHRVRRAAAVCGAFTLGIALFSGSLYVMTVSGARWLGAVTPLGGLSFLVGWIVLAAGVVPPYREGSPQPPKEAP